MPGKSRRIASRQSQLKRKKTTKGPSGIPTGRRVPAPVDDEPVVVPARGEEHEVAAQPDRSFHPREIGSSRDVAGSVGVTSAQSSEATLLGGT